LTFRDAVYLRDLRDECFRAQGLPVPKAAVETTSIQSSFRLIGQNDYLMLLPNTFLREKDALNIIPLQVNGLTLVCDVGLIYRATLLRIPGYAKFRELLVEECCADPVRT
jgi:hypothetical protein